MNFSLCLGHRLLPPWLLFSAPMPPTFHPGWAASPFSSFPLPAHFDVGPTKDDPVRGAFNLRRVQVRGLPLPLHEDFGDAFGGKSFVRFPQRDIPAVHGRSMRLRSQPPAYDSLWLPDYCIRGNNSLEIQQRTRARPRTSPALRGLATSARR